MWPSVVPYDDQSDYPSVAQIFAYGAQTPSEDADVSDEWSKDSDDYVAQSLLETAAYLSISAERRVSVAVTVERLQDEIQSDESYKYLRQVVNGNVRISKFEGDLAVYNYHKDNLTVSQEGLVMYKGSRFVVPTVLSITFRTRRSW